ncbi:MAG: excinuclease ABC subunit UvrA, partial [Candidatus Cloacimonetes bacterium]|nr:excinuclease ABC subunit UvrA [Candidatus Cloacimonadota bacterium]
QTTQMCYKCNHFLFEITPATFSFNNPESCCPVCNGVGKIAEIDTSLIITNPESSLLDNASPFWGDLRKFRTSPNANWMKGEVLALAAEMGVDLELPWNQLNEEFRQKALFGSNGQKVSFRYKNQNGRTGEITRPVEGAVNILKRLLAEGSGTERIVESFTRAKLCPACLGERLSREGRLVTVGGKRLPEIVSLPVSQLKLWVEELPGYLQNNEFKLAKPIMLELHRLCNNFILAGLSYITLNRTSSTLSGGELQRTRLVTQLVNGITNVSYILDEPFMGLNQKDVEKLFTIIEDLKNNGNTVIMVEHNRYAMLKSDNIIDIGPGAGLYGGEIIAEGSPLKIMDNPNSQTGQFLNESKTIKIDKSYSPDLTHQIIMKGAKANNLKNIDVAFPSGAIVCICGVSGSGKSSLVEECLYPAVTSALAGITLKDKNFESIEGTEIFSEIIFVNQKPIGRNSRSNPATYTGLMDEIRTIFAKTDAAREKGFKAGRFSFNNKEGQCQECNGEGIKHLSLPFVSDTEVECPCCKGKQFNKETLEIEYKGKNIADILQMSVDEALTLFDCNIKLHRILQTLHEIGLGYIKLGQNSTSLSGGEAQRIKLATQLCTQTNGRVIYILDEPSSGLHFEDVRNLMTVLQKIVSVGNTVVMVEHNDDIIKNSDVIIELGPTGGEQGGYLINQIGV